MSNPILRGAAKKAHEARLRRESNTSARVSHIIRDDDNDDDDSLANTSAARARAHRETGGKTVPGYESSSSPVATPSRTKRKQDDNRRSSYTSISDDDATVTTKRSKTSHKSPTSPTSILKSPTSLTSTNKRSMKAHMRTAGAGGFVDVESLDVEYSLAIDSDVEDGESTALPCYKCSKSMIFDKASKSAPRDTTGLTQGAVMDDQAGCKFSASVKCDHCKATRKPCFEVAAKFQPTLRRFVAKVAKYQEKVDDGSATNDDIARMVKGQQQVVLLVDDLLRPSG